MHHNLPINPLRVVIAPDSFKGTLAAPEVAESLAEGWRTVRPTDDVSCIPMADGGEGTLAAVAAALPEAHLVTTGSSVPGPLGEPVPSRWLRIGQHAVVELAAVAGLGLVAQPSPVTALGAATDGLGVVMQQALEAGVSTIAVAVGGSASTDGGLGALRALGLVARDARGDQVLGGGGALARVRSLEVGLLRCAARVTVLTDVRAPLTGESGAAYVYAPQKGADASTTRTLDEGLQHWARLWHQQHVSPALAEVAGTGAAGGVAYGLAAGLGAGIRSGAQWVIECTQLAAHVAAADVVITGEGRFDAQSLTGKLVSHVLTLPGNHQRWIVAGELDIPAPPPAQAVSLHQLAGSREAAMAQPARWLRVAGEQLARTWAT